MDLLKWLLVFAFMLLALTRAPAVEQDCNGNRREDRDDIASGFSSDCNANCIPDECDLLPTYGATQRITAHRVEYPFAIAALDLDADGDTDLVSANRDSNNLSVFRNDGSGGFPIRANIQVGTEPLAMAVGDWDGDGDEDLAVVFAGDGRVGILRNDGSGLPSIVQTLAAGDTPEDVAAGDFDGDGHTDIAVAVRSPATVWLFRNSGGGSFSKWRELTVGFSPRVTITAGDLNGDALPDLVVDSRFSIGTDTYDGIAILKNKGNGSFELPQNRRTTHSPESIAIADIDGDGHQDLAVAEDSQLLGVFWSLGGGLFPSVADEWTLDRSITDVAVCDTDGDGDLDVVLGGSGIYIVENPSSREFESFVILEDSESSGRHSVAVTDLDGDGDADIASVHTNWLFRAYENVSGWFPLREKDFLRFTARDVTTGRFDGVGTVDVLVLDSESAAVAFLPNSGGSRFDRAFPFAISGDPQDLNDVASADLNEDGLDDAVLADFSASSSLYLLLSSGGLPFQEQRMIVLAEWPHYVATGDIDGDGHSDIAVAERGTRVTILWNDGAARFAVHSVDLPYRPGPLVLEDFDGDGRLDLAIASGKSVWIYLLRPGSSVPRGPFPIDNSDTSGSAVSIAAADIDRDGRMDLAAGFSRSLNLLRNRALAELDSVVQVEVPWVNSSRYTVGDLTGNGWPEFVGVGDDLVLVEMQAPQRSQDEDGDGLPDECTGGVDPPADCNSNGLPDSCDLAQQFSSDCNGNLVPDECDIASGESSDCNLNDRPDECDLTLFVSFDCNRNEVPDECDIASGRSGDEDGDGIPDECSTPEFLRGDVNGDGVVTISDAYALEWGYYQTRVDVHPERIPCQDAWDADDDGQVYITDAALIEEFVIGVHPGPPPPYPEPGFDLTDDPLDCRLVEPRQALVDPQAKLSILDAVARGGNDGTVLLRFALASSVPIGGFFASIDVGQPTVLEGARREWMQGLTGPEDAARDIARAGNRLNFYWIRAPSTAGAYPPSESIPVLEIRACLDAGVTAGDYPLTLFDAELIEYEGGRRIEPVLESATLSVRSDLTTTEFCQSPPPFLVCGVDAVYVSGILALRFELGSAEPIDWSVWIIGSSFVFPLINTRIPAVEPAVTFPVAFRFPAGLGAIAILSVLTPGQGDTCSDFAIVNTGSPASQAGAAVPGR